MAKLRIDLATGQIEVEGDEVLLKTVYEDFKERLKETKVASEQLHGNKPAHPALENGQKSIRHARKGVYGRKESWSMIKDLNLRGNGEIISLRDFYAEKNPSNNMENNTVFVYYLERKLGVTGISVNHVYTCYKDVNQHLPGALLQSLYDTSNRKAWIDTANVDNIRLTTHGENLVEHDLPPKKKEHGKK